MMKITKQLLREIIEEELKILLSEDQGAEAIKAIKQALKEIQRGNYTLRSSSIGHYSDGEVEAYVRIGNGRAMKVHLLPEGR